MALYRFEDPGDLAAPVLIAAFDGWIDAGSAATMALGRLAEGARTIATFDADSIYDYRARRPTLDVLDGTLVDLEWPELELRATRVDGHDLLILTGPEPDYRWRELADDVVRLATRLEIASWISLGAIPAAVAHTRPVPVLGTASGPGLLRAGILQGPAGRLRVPSAALSVLEMAVARAGMPAVGLYAQVPHYVSGDYAAAAIALLEHLGRHLELELPSGALPAEARKQRMLLDTATASDERTKAYVEQLETMTDEARLPEGDELIDEIERFLRERGSEGRASS
jgi:hypothetical protein